MSASKASQIVSGLLEYDLNPDFPAAGGPDDMWRQSGGSPLPAGTSFGGRPGPELAPEDELDMAVPENPAITLRKKRLAQQQAQRTPPPAPAAPGETLPPKHGSRFQWKPPAPNV